MKEQIEHIWINRKEIERIHDCAGQNRTALAGAIKEKIESAYNEIMAEALGALDHKTLEVDKARFTIRVSRQNKFVSIITSSGTVFNWDIDWSDGYPTFRYGFNFVKYEGHSTKSFAHLIETIAGSIGGYIV